MLEVTCKDIKDYDKAIIRKATRFISKFNRGYTKGSDASIGLVCWNFDDICQELRIAVWCALVNYDVEKTETVNGTCKKDTFVYNCMDNRLGAMATHIFADKRGFESYHDSESMIINGEHCEEA